jgi:hypothetical protein
LPEASRLTPSWFDITIAWLVLVVFGAGMVHFITAEELSVQSALASLQRRWPWLLVTLTVVPVLLLVPRSIRSVLFLTVELAILGVYASYTLWLWYVRRRSGTVLLDLGRGRGQVWLLCLAAYWCGLIALELLWQPVGRDELVDSAIYAVVALGLVSVALGRTQLRDRGVLGPDGPVRWRDINGFSWSEEGGKLILHTQRRFRVPWWRTMKVEVPADLQSEVSRVLRERAANFPFSLGSPT